jgi:hypothetical protein
MPDELTQPSLNGENQPATKGDVNELAAMTTREFSHVHEKIDKDFARVDTRMDGLETRMDRGFTEVKDAIRELTGTVRGISENHEARLKRLEQPWARKD